ncbi:helix-turn-helix domain-containing protein [Saccharomonospora sp. CUA-673]|uniref:helix-turn-helix domain-containing protein n=1 Tax=Saccharomonospora sp. CUA-673 TaxID=1904969 RepID=UPI0009FB5D12|nr:helix-turn-helix domain-containing protein [Saccharomonospora sp. CUA-673]
MDAPGLTRFRTSDVAEPRRLAAWEEHNARSLVGLTASPIGDRPFSGVEVNLALPRLQLARVTGSPHVVDRGPRQIATAPADGVVVYVALAGHGRFEHRAGDAVLGPGQLLVCDADQPFRRGFSDGLTELVLKAPRAVLRDATGHGGLARPRTVDLGAGSTEAGAAHARALAAAVADAFRGPTGWETVEATILELLPAVLGRSSPDAGHLAAAHAFITARLADPGLSAGGIARAVGISERQLSRLFAAAGQSVPQAVQSARLDAARRMLADPTHAGTPLAEVAGRHGFASQAHFSRSYRARFGTTPSRDRRASAD